MRNPPAGLIVLPLGYKKYPVVYWTMYTTGYFLYPRGNTICPAGGLRIALSKC